MAGTAGAVRANSEAGLWVRWGGHVEGLRRRRGDAVGVKAGASLIDRFRGERGNHPRSPSPPGSRSGWWAGPLPTDGRGMGRRPRSSPSTREACTWRRGPASRQGGYWDARRPLVNTDESELALFRAERRVREIQAKLHRWADHDPQRDLWSARCPETGTAGAGGGSGKPTGGNTGRAPRADLTGRGAPPGPPGSVFVQVAGEIARGRWLPNCLIAQVEGALAMGRRVRWHRGCRGGVRAHIRACSTPWA